MQIGRLDTRVTVQVKTTTEDGQGGRSTSWGTLAEVWANVNPLRMVERLQAAAIGSKLGYLVTIYWRADVTPAMRIQWTPYRSTTAKTLEIHGVMPVDGLREFLELDCSEVI